MEKRPFLFKILDDMRASYWFLPSILVIFGMLLATGTVWLDYYAASLPFELPQSITDTQADGARSLLAAIAQSIIGVTGVMFSMTVVAVSSASGNFGPRLISNFMRDRGNQWSLGILIATFVYALLVLRSVQGEVVGSVDAFVPHFAIMVALLLTLLCVFTMIYFVHHVPETINVSRIAANLGDRLEQSVRGLIDDKHDDPVTEQWPDGTPTSVVRADNSGYIQTSNFDRLQKIAKKNEWHIDMLPAIGDFITIETEVFQIWSAHTPEDAQIEDLKDCLSLGLERTESQNPSFLAHQLVEMVARALSPGVNDPYTAVDCLNRLTSVLTVASVYRGGLRIAQTERLRYPQLDFASLFAVTFPLCCQYIKPDDLTKNHSLDLLERLKETVRMEDKSLIQKEISKLSA